MALSLVFIIIQSIFFKVRKNEIALLAVITKELSTGKPLVQCQPVVFYVIGRDSSTPTQPPPNHRGRNNKACPIGGYTF